MTTVKSNVATLDINLKGITQRVSSTENVTTTLTTNVNKAQTDANTANSKIDGLEIGGRNLVKNSDVLQNLFSQLGGYMGIRTVVVDSDARCGKRVEFKCTTAGTGFHLPLLVKTPNMIDKVFTWSFWAKCTVVKTGTVGHESGGQRTIELTTEWKKFTHTWTMNSREYTSFTFYQNWKAGEILYIRDFKIESGTKDTDWTDAPEDTQEQLDNNKTEITTTNNKVSLIETNLSSITSRVSNVETTTRTIDGKITAVDTRLKTAEQKITDASIISTVSSQFYKKGETDNKYASQTQIAQLDNKIALKVDVNGVKTAIELNPTSVKIGFNKINNSIQFTEGEMQINIGNRKSLTLKSGRLNAYDTSTGKVLGYVGQTYTDVNGLRCPGQVFGSGYHSYYTIFGLDANWDSDDKQTGTDFDAFMNICYFNYKDLQRGIYFNKPVNFNDSAPIEAQKINIAQSISAKYNNTITIGDMTNAIYRVFTNGIRSKTYDLELLAGNATYGSLNVTESGYFHPQNNAGYSLGTDVKRFHTLYVSNPVSVSSDRNLKDDIEYLVGQNSNTISTSDMYYFVKDELKLASYNYKSSKIRNEIIDMKKNIGFIAQDLEGSKVGEEIIRRGRDGILSYDSGNYQNVLAGALKEALNKIDILERKLAVLESVAS